MDNYHQMEVDLLCGVLDALPYPTVLLNRNGEPAFTNPLADELALDSIDFASLPLVLDALTVDAVCHGVKLTLTPADGAMLTGIVQVYPVQQEDTVAGALVFFQPLAEPEVEDAPWSLPYVSSAIADVWGRIGRLANINAGVLFIGETGVGRESFARALHNQSAQRHMPFVVVDCRPATGGMTAFLADGERQREAATAGVCYFDSVEAMSAAEQAQFLTIIKNKKLAGEDITARLLYACQPVLEEQTTLGKFSAELKTRISLLHLTIPPLRERPDDIPPIARHYLAKYARLYQKPVTDFSEDVWRQLVKHEWPHNLQDMETFIKESVLASQGTIVTAEAVPFAVTQSVSLRRARHKFSYARIDALLAVYGHTTEGKRRAAQELGIGLSSLYRLLANYERDRKRGNL